MNPMSLRELETEFWKLYSNSLRGILLFTSSILYLLVLLLNFPLQHLSYWLRVLAAHLLTWQPIKPAIFNLDSEG